MSCSKNLALKDLQVVKITCGFLDADSFDESAVYLGAGVLEVHVGLLRRHPLHSVLPGEGHRVLDLEYENIFQKYFTNDTNMSGQ